MAAPCRSIPELPEGHPMLLVHRLSACLCGENDVDLDAYCDLWADLCSFIVKWGVLLKFVTDDINLKVGGIRELRSIEEKQSRTFVSLTAWEDREGKMRIYSPKSGTVYLLLLHRALAFVIKLIDDVYKTDDDGAKVSTIARVAYDKTMAAHHPWLVRKVVGAALLALPYRKEFLCNMRGPMPATDDHHFHSAFMRNANNVYSRMASRFEKYNMTDFSKHSA